MLAIQLGWRLNFLSENLLQGDYYIHELILSNRIGHFFWPGKLLYLWRLLLLSVERLNFFLYVFSSNTPPKGTQLGTQSNFSIKKELSGNLKTLFITWSGRQDLNLRPLVPQTSALPDCATPRTFFEQATFITL